MMGPKPIPPAERFWPKVDTDVPGTSCWLWTAGKAKGYGRFSVTPTHIVNAHRWAYEALIAPIPPGLTIDHLCEVTACVNPHHLEPVTLVENVRRSTKAADARRARTHCPQRHPYDEANTYVDPQGHRNCRACSYEAGRRYRARRAAARRADVAA